MKRGAWMIFRWPLLLALLGGIGLVSALVGDGFFDLLAWLGLGVPLALIAVAWLRPTRRGAGR
ncbi:hypothetical protein [Pseudomonas mangiferae]|uniref:DUF4175 domain-containing protein n=1 Tax=Pseudomonas mangiferae TaxID=2593654 RepID=A0A553GYW0_9PSED|nr:hypothetical protein [Pseudomonas mangiferae]TRX74662.1 hypothetical protein FM069_11690 [Pseudomonas mangiferae]